MVLTRSKNDEEVLYDVLANNERKKFDTQFEMADSKF